MSLRTRIDNPIRTYQPEDIEAIINVYKSAFAEPPWDEFLKCATCDVNYGREELSIPPDDCKRCNEPLQLTACWSAADIKSDIDNALSQVDPVALVCAREAGIVGFAWGYRLPTDKFPFLENRTSMPALYLDDIAVRADSRGQGVGRALGSAFLSAAARAEYRNSVLRTDRRNSASMSLFRGLGYRILTDGSTQGTPLLDPQYPDRVYLATETKEDRR